MEVAAAKQLLPSMARDPNSPSSSTSSSSPSSAAASPTTAASHHRLPSSSHSQALPPSPRPVTVPRTIDTTPFPTTFVQADTASFKQVVQMLTGSDTPSSTQSQRPPAKSHHQHGGGGGQAGGVASCRPKKPAFKLYERRSVHKNLKMIAPLAMAAAAAAGASPRKAAQEVLSPSVLDFPSLALSPVTPLVADPFNRSPASASASASPAEEEAAAIAQKGFFLHPSPRSAEPPRLLPLFPVTSPRVATAAASPALQ
ncbi:VQ motif-containing protein 4-like [Oryza brachyantha]|uniref:VQ domain-containing protein n=1 Tax=Oryza brachyantha TaxID=4533 RepID=J3M8Y2_ORYBR|nr:VQ motif-containing protein 4-like [Oryza brachyantha]